MLFVNLTHWGRVTHICVSDLTSIGSDNGLSPGRHQAIIRTNAGILLIRPLGTNFSEFLVEILIFSFKKMRLKVSSAKRRPFCLGLNVKQLVCQWSGPKLCCTNCILCYVNNVSFTHLYCIMGVHMWEMSYILSCLYIYIYYAKVNVYDTESLQ